jgi:putative ABC transport system ATP-binding protein
VNPLIAATDVTKVFNRGRPDEVAALHRVCVEIGRGDVAVLKGPSGSGKTTLLSLIACMARPTSGRILLDGRDVAKLPERFLTQLRRRRFGFIFQQFHLVRGVSVLENVLLPLYPLEVGFAAMRARGEEVLRRLRIWDRRRLRPNQLSGGEQQRVAIARALINDPDIVIADEPTAHLDRELSAEFLDILQGINGEGKTIVIATHDPFVYEHPLVKTVLRLRDGWIEGQEPA